MSSWGTHSPSIQLHLSATNDCCWKGAGMAANSDAKRTILKHSLSARAAWRETTAARKEVLSLACLLVAYCKKIRMASLFAAHAVLVFSFLVSILIVWCMSRTLNHELKSWLLGVLLFWLLCLLFAWQTASAIILFADAHTGKFTIVYSRASMCNTKIAQINLTVTSTVVPLITCAVGLVTNWWKVAMGEL